MNGRCPHDHVQFCPLYVVAHEQRAELLRLTCCSGDMLMEGCAVERGTMDYRRQVALVASIDPRMVATVRFNEEARAAKDQKARNLRLAGIH